MTDFDLDSEMEQDGYIPGVPSWGLTEEYGSDTELCANSTCQACGQRGLELKPFLDWSSQSYKAFAECPRCGSTEELQPQKERDTG